MISSSLFVSIFFGFLNFHLFPLLLQVELNHSFSSSFPYSSSLISGFFSKLKTFILLVNSDLLYLLRIVLIVDLQSLSFIVEAILWVITSASIFLSGIGISSLWTFSSASFSFLKENLFPLTRVFSVKRETEGKFSLGFNALRFSYTLFFLSEFILLSLSLFDASLA